MAIGRVSRHQSEKSGSVREAAMGPCIRLRNSILIRCFDAGGDAAGCDVGWLGVFPVIEMSLSSWLVAGVVPGVERQPLKKPVIDESALLKLLNRLRETPCLCAKRSPAAARSLMRNAVSRDTPLANRTEESATQQNACSICTLLVPLLIVDCAEIPMRAPWS